jgi:hypothetical protein
VNIYALGKAPARLDARTFRLSSFLKPITPPPAKDWAAAVTDWGMMMNDVLGICVGAGAGHTVQQWTKYAGVEHVVPDSKILQTYEKVGGYVPGDPSTDNGMDMLSYLNFWRQHGLGEHRKHRIQAFVTVNPANLQEMRTAIYLFGNVYLGVQLPLTAQGADSWQVPPGGLQGDGAPGSWGGHCVPVMAYDPTSYTVITWGQPMMATAAFVADYADEAYALLSPDWLSGAGLAPSGFDLAALEAALAKL